MGPSACEISGRALGRLVVDPRPRKVGAPRAHGGQSRFPNPGPDPHQSPAGPWRLHMREGFFRRIQDSPLKCRDSSRRSTSLFKTVFLKKVSNFKTFLGGFLALIEVATGPSKNAVNRACGHLGGPLGFSKLFLETSAGTPGPLWNGKMAARSLGNAFAVRKTDRLHFCNGLWRPAPSHAVNMQSIWPSLGPHHCLLPQIDCIFAMDYGTLCPPTL